MEHLSKRNKNEEAISEAWELLQAEIAERDRVLECYRERKTEALQAFNRGTLEDWEYRRIDIEIERQRDDALYGIYARVLQIAKLDALVQSSWRAVSFLTISLARKGRSLKNGSSFWVNDAEKGLACLVKLLSGSDWEDAKVVVPVPQVQISESRWEDSIKPAIQTVYEIAQSVRLEPIQQAFQRTGSVAEQIGPLGMEALERSLNHPGMEALKRPLNQQALQKKPNPPFKKQKSKFLQGVDKMLSKRTTRRI